MNTTTKRTSRHGQAAPGKRKVSVVANESALAILQKEADADHRPLSLFLSLLMDREAARLRQENR